MRTDEDESVETPLRGLRVIEFEAIGPGPLAGRMLRDLGAHVTVVARPTTSAVDRALIGDEAAVAIARYQKARMWELKAMESLDAIREAGAVGIASRHKPAMKI